MRPDFKSLPPVGHLGLGALLGAVLGAAGATLVTPRAPAQVILPPPPVPAIFKPAPAVTPSTLPTREPVEAVERAKQFSYAAGEATASARTIALLATPDNLQRAMPGVAQAIVQATVLAGTPSPTAAQRPVKLVDTTRIAEATRAVESTRVAIVTRIAAAQATAGLPMRPPIPTTTETVHVVGTPSDPYPGPP